MNPIERGAIKRVADACKANGKFFALHAGAKLLDLFTNEIDFDIQGLDNDFCSMDLKAYEITQNKVLPDKIIGDKMTYKFMKFFISRHPALDKCRMS